MTITNGYCSLEELKAYAIPNADTDSADDAVLEGIIEDASRLIDAVCGRWFYAYNDTRRFNLPRGRTLYVDADLLAVTTLTNGDGTVIPSTEYRLLPGNYSPHYAVRLKDSSSVDWEEDADGEVEDVIAIAGSWGYVDRSATDPESARVIRNTRQACLEIATQRYNERYGRNTGGQVQVTGMGVVITPQGAVPKAAYDAIRPYIRVV